MEITYYPPKARRVSPQEFEGQARVSPQEYHRSTTVVPLWYYGGIQVVLQQFEGQGRVSPQEFEGQARVSPQEFDGLSVGSEDLGHLTRPPHSPQSFGDDLSSPEPGVLEITYHPPRPPS